MLTLVTYPPAFGQSSASPFCVKAEFLLNLSGMPWQREDTHDPRRWPKGKLPALRANGEIIGDSDNIRMWLEQNGFNFDGGLSDLDRATSRAYIRMAEEHMYFHLVLDRWENDQAWPTVRDTYFSTMPPLIRRFVTAGLRKSLLRGLNVQGLGRLTPEERLARIEPDFVAITDRLWQGPFLFGAAPTAADASVAAILGAMAVTPCATALSKRVAEDDILMGYVGLVTEALGHPASEQV